MSRGGSDHLQPLAFEPILLEKVWGGRRLARWGKTLPGSARFGESWELADLPNTTPSGGGSEARSRVSGGPWHGRPPRDLIGELGQSLLGTSRATDRGDFPLLVKWLDAREHLSVQVHPSPAYAKSHPECHLKTECWYVLEAEPQAGRPAVIYRGLREGVTRVAFERALRTGDGSGVVELLQAIQVQPGECYTLPSGTIHALGAGVLAAEVQTPSDTTFRVYDWTREYARPARAMHVDPALECIDFSAPSPGPCRSLARGASRALVADTPFFRVWDAMGPGEVRPIGPAGFVILMPRSTGARLIWPTGWMELHKGRTLLVPAAIAGQARVEGPNDAGYLLVTAGTPV